MLITSPFWSSMATTPSGFIAPPAITLPVAWRNANCTLGATVPPSEANVTVPKASASGKIRDQFPSAGLATCNVTSVELVACWTTLTLPGRFAAV